MGENKGQTIFLSVIGIATLLVAIIGATFAYFTTSMGGTQGTVKATTAKIGAASFTAQSVSGTAVLPGWTSEAKTVTVTLGASDYDVKYTCTLDMTKNPLTDLTLTVAGTLILNVLSNVSPGSISLAFVKSLPPSNVMFPTFAVVSAVVPAVPVILVVK